VGRLDALMAADAGKMDAAAADETRKALTTLKQEVDAASMSVHLKAGVRAGIAEHDKVLLKRIKQLAAANTDKAAAAALATATEAAEAGDKFVVLELGGGVDAKAMQPVVQKVIKQCGIPVIALSASDDKVACVAAVPKEVEADMPANEWLTATLAAVGGRGGGKPSQAQGSGSDVAGMSRAKELARSFASEKV